MRIRSFLRISALVPVAVCAGWLVSPTTVTAADHGDGPAIGNDRAGDLGDVYFFVDPMDSTKVCLIGTFHGFIVPGEAVNFGGFDPAITYRFEIENTGDAKFDQALDVTFAARTGGTAAQTATVTYAKGKTGSFTAPTTPPSLAATANPMVVTADATSGLEFFAGVVDDPFFFDIPGFSRFVASVLSGAPNTAQLARGRDTFAGYNTLAIAVRAPISYFQGKGTATTIGVGMSALRGTQKPSKKGGLKSSGKPTRVDRAAIPGVNAVFLPFGRRDAYNAADAVPGAANPFAPDIVATLTALGTNSTNIGTLAAVAVNNGDYLRLDTTVANTGPGGGNNSGAGFPNGRRLSDDVIDTVLGLVANGTLGDSVPANDATFQDVFPYMALPQQPRANGVTDDNTRN